MTKRKNAAERTRHEILSQSFWKPFYMTIERTIRSVWMPHPRGMVPASVQLPQKEGEQHRDKRDPHSFC